MIKCTSLLLLLLVLSTAAARQFAQPGRRLKVIDMSVSPDKPSATVAAVVANIGPVEPNKDNSSNSTLAQQVHLTYWKSPDKMLVSFVTGAAKLANGPVTAADLPSTSMASAQPAVRLGTQPGVYARQLHNNSQTTAYVQNNNWPTSPYSQGYVSGLIHHVLLTGLQPGTTYFYSVAPSPKGPWSQEFNFTTFNSQGATNFPFRIGYMADLGNSYNASTTVKRMIGSGPQLVANLGDISYADVYAPNGIYADKKYKAIKPLKYHLTYQSAWDQNGHMLQPLAAHVPMMTTPGNHELEFQPDGTVMAAYNARFPIPQSPQPQLAPLTMMRRSSEAAAANSTHSPTNNMYYSFDIPGVAHLIFITPYIPNDTWTSDTPQYKWLEADLKSFNRTATPWLIVNLHAPLVSSWQGSFKDAECMRLVYEPLLFKYNVDLVFNGHTHAYERSKPVYNYKSNGCGAVHITIGCGGKPGKPDEALDDITIEDACKNDPTFSSPEVWSKSQAANPTIFGGRQCATVQNDLGGFCWSKGQPAFSAVRTSAFGHGTLDILNATHAEWAFYRNSDAPGSSMDKVMLNRAAPVPCPLLP